MSLYLLLAATPQKASRGTWGEGNEFENRIFNFSFKSLRKLKQNKFFSRGNLPWEGGGTLSQNSYEPSQNLWEATL